MYERVLLPLSGDLKDDRTFKALEKAEKICSGELIVLHVTEPVSQAVTGAGREEVINEDTAKALMLLEPVIERLRIAKAHFHTRIVSGTIADTIIRIADEENADIIVMYTDGRDQLADLFLGSVTERVLRDTNKDLLVIKG